MTLNITEANGLNLVLRLLLHRPMGTDQAQHGEQRVMPLVETRAAAMMLADKAHRPLMAGLTGADVERMWDGLVQRRAALMAFLDIWDDADMLHTIASSLTCPEADALAQLLDAYDRHRAAEAVLARHRETDEEGDEHYQGVVGLTDNPARPLRLVKGGESDD